jgi:hypothetical protein
MMSAEIDRQAIVDEEHLKLLFWGYIVSGAFTAMFSFLAMIYIVIGCLMALAPALMAGGSAKPVEQPPAFLGWIFLVAGLVLFFFIATVAILKFVTARKIRRRKSKLFCMVMAGLSCLEFPYGMLLGVMTFIVLGRESVAKLFDGHAAV